MRKENEERERERGEDGPSIFLKRGKRK
jgi:hypothetical protein